MDSQVFQIVSAVFSVTAFYWGWEGFKDRNAKLKKSRKEPHVLEEMLPKSYLREYHPKYMSGHKYGPLKNHQPFIV